MLWSCKQYRPLPATINMPCIISGNLARWQAGSGVRDSVILGGFMIVYKLNVIIDDSSFLSKRSLTGYTVQVKTIPWWADLDNSENQF